MNKELNHLLANFVVTYHKLQSFHWYVKGSDFFQVHLKLEELYNEINMGIDELAELLLQIGGEPVSSLRGFLELASIDERTDSFVDSEEVIKTVVADYEALLAEIVSVKKVADEQEAYLVSASMDTFIASFTKTLWMLRQSR